MVVTGASSGMGKACALRLSEAGYAVFAGVRRETDGQSLRSQGPGTIVPVILDVTRGATITKAVREVREAVGSEGLTGLVNNAGVAVTGPLELLPLGELRRQFEINVIGQVAVIQGFLPLIRAAQGRILNVGSVGARFAVPFGAPLNSSKAAIESINDSLRMELRPWGIRVVLISPGSIRTPAENKLAADSEKMLNAFPQEGRARYGPSYGAFVQALLALESRGVGPEVMAETVLRALEARHPRSRYPVGPRSRLLPFLFTRLPSSLADRMRMRLFGVHPSCGHDRSLPVRNVPLLRT